MHLRFIPLMLILISFSDCNNSKIQPSFNLEDEVINLDIIPALKIEKPVLLSELVDSIEYIKLETTSECYFNYAQWAFTSNYIALAGWNPSSILLFSRDGEFIRKFGKKGNGPGEYNWTFSVDISPKEDKIIIQDEGKRSIIEYSIDGSHIQTLNYKGSMARVYYHDQNTVIYKQDYLLDSLDFPLIVALDLETHKEIPLYFTNMKKVSDFGRAFYNASQISRTDNGIVFKHYRNDTLFTINPDLKPLPRIIVNIENTPEKSYTMYPEDQNINAVTSIIELPGLLFIQGNFNKSPFHIVYDISYGDFRALPRIINNGQADNSKFRIINDLDGLETIWLDDNDYIRNGEYITRHDLMDLKEMCKSQSFKEMNLVTEKYRNYLIELVEGSAIDDNPIMRVLHFKEK